MTVQRHPTREAAETELVILRDQPWPVHYTSGVESEVQAIAPQDIVAFAAKVGQEIIVDAGSVREMAARWGGQFYVNPPSLEVYDDYRE